MDLLLRQAFDISMWDAKHVVSYFSQKLVSLKLEFVDTSKPHSGRCFQLLDETVCWIWWLCVTFHNKIDALNTWNETSVHFQIGFGHAISVVFSSMPNHAIYGDRESQRYCLLSINPKMISSASNQPQQNQSLRWVSFDIYEPRDGWGIHYAVAHMARVVAMLKKWNSLKL